MLDVILNVCCSPTAEKSIVVVDMCRAGVSEAAACCVTVTARVGAPTPLTVMVAIRGDAPVLAAAVTVTVPLSAPPVGETISQPASLPTVQFVLEATVKIFCSPTSEKSRILVETVKVNVSATVACCVTLTVRDVTPVPLMVMVAVRDDTPVLAAATTVTVPLSEPEAGVMVSHDALLPTVQLTLDVMLKVRCSPAAAKLSMTGETLSEGGA